MVKKNDIDKQIEVVDGTMTEEEASRPDNEYKPLYQPYEDSKIPVSKSTGKFWETRKKEALAHLDSSKVKDRWDEAIRYYQNDQGARTGKRGQLAQVSTGSDSAPKHSTENIVFANVSALVPAVYAKNPDIELTANDSKDEARATLYERLIDNLFAGKVSPCVAIKPKMRRAVVTTTLTNIAYLEVSYVKKEASGTAVVEEMVRLSKELQEAKDVKAIEEIEGKLMALESKVNLLDDAGPRVRVRQPDEVIRDPNAEEGSDLSSDQYVMISDFLRTSFIQACYGKKNEKGEWMSVYQPTHLLTVQANPDISGHDDEINNFTLLGDQEDYSKYGYKNQEEYENAKRTKVWYVWDRVTRRVLMFNDKDWSWPIWVWDDPYHLTSFFPVFPLTFYTDPIDIYGRSEVMYYLDQQDEINTINNEKARMRHWVMTKVFVNTDKVDSVTKVQDFLSGNSNDTVYGLPLGDNGDVSKAIGTLAPPSSQFEGLFDSRFQLESINRISSVTPVLKASEFKTNTTNKAIETYNSSTQTRLDEKIDAVEDILADVGNALIEMCVQFMDEETVASIVDDIVLQKAGGWTMYDNPKKFHEEFSFKIVGGSTQKPTSQVKKDMAIQLGQVLGQFAQASPAIVMILLKVISRAFNDDVVITEEDWAMVTQSMQQGEGEGDPNQVLEQAMAQVEKMFNQLDDQTRQQVAQAIAQGTPLKQIVQGLMAKGQQQAQQGQQPTQQAAA